MLGLKLIHIGGDQDKMAAASLGHSELKYKKGLLKFVPKGPIHNKLAFVWVYSLVEHLH